MEKLPHHYLVSADMGAGSLPQVSSPGLPGIVANKPAEFGGPGDAWSPETLLMAAIASCFTLSFEAVATAARFDYVDLRCDANGTLDRVDRVTRFTEIVQDVRLTIPAGGDVTKARQLLEKAEHVCLVSNSLNAAVTLNVEVTES